MSVKKFNVSPWCRSYNLLLPHKFLHSRRNMGRSFRNTNFFTFRPNCWRYKALSDWPGLQTPIQRFFCMYTKISLRTIQILQNSNLCKIPPPHHDCITFAICQRYIIWKICFWFFFCGHDSLVEKRNYSRKLLFVDKPDIYDASVRWVFASAVLKDSSTQPRFMNAEVLIIQILILHDKLLWFTYPEYSGYQRTYQRRDRYGQCGQDTGVPCFFFLQRYVWHSVAWVDARTLDLKKGPRYHGFLKHVYTPEMSVCKTR